jgi:predicted Kef-type K+ transport protein
MFTDLLIVVAAGLLAPLALGFFPRVRLPAIVLEIVLGIVIGPAGLGWVRPDPPVTILALIGLAFLLFLSGLEIDVERLRGPIVKVTALGFAVSFAIALLIGTGLKSAGFVKSPLFVAIVLVATSLGVIFPVLVFFSGKSSTSTAGRPILLGIFGLVVVLVGLAIASAERSVRLSRVLRRLQDTTAQIRVRAAFLLLIGFTALAATQIGLQLGIVSRASAAGLVAAGLLSVVISPALGLILLRHGRPESTGPRPRPTPVLPVLTAGDSALARPQNPGPAA